MRRLALGALVAVMTLFWIWIFVFVSRENPDRLEGREFPARAEEICGATQAAINDLPSAQQTPLPADRAVQVAIGTDLTEKMVTDVRATTHLITNDDDLEIVDSWLEDWDAYVHDRRRHVERLEAADESTPGRDTAFTLTERSASGFYTRRIDGFANVNDMVSCHVPLDV